MDTSAKRAAGSVLLIVALVLAAIAAQRLIWPSSEQARQQYQAALVIAPGGVDPDHGLVIGDDGRMSTAYLDVACDKRCMVAQEVDGGYAVTLPVGYTYRPGPNVFSEPFAPKPVVRLTYWDPTTHRPATVSTWDGRGVVLPEVLEYRPIEAMQAGETAYISPDAVRYDTYSGSTVILADAPVTYEPGGWFYSTSTTAELVRKDAHFEVRLPNGEEPRSDYQVTGWVAVVLPA